MYLYFVLLVCIYLILFLLQLEDLNFLEKEKYVKQVEKIEYHLQKYTKNNLFLILFYTKIIYGASIPALVYLGAKKTSYSKFSYYNLYVIRKWESQRLIKKQKL